MKKLLIFVSCFVFLFLSSTSLVHAQDSAKAQSDTFYRAKVLAIAGSIGLIAAVPLTTFMAAFFVSRMNKSK